MFGALVVGLPPVVMILDEVVGLIEQSALDCWSVGMGVGDELDWKRRT
jgi:hypothetical protein